MAAVFMIGFDPQLPEEKNVALEMLKQSDGYIRCKKHKEGLYIVVFESVESANSAKWALEALAGKAGGGDG